MICFVFLLIKKIIPAKELSSVVSRVRTQYSENLHENRIQKTEIKLTHAGANNYSPLHESLNLIIVLIRHTTLLGHDTTNHENKLV